MASQFEVTDVTAVDLTKPVRPAISTGVGFFDHMIDQFNSHAQIGVSVAAIRSRSESSDQSGRKRAEEGDVADKNRYAAPPDDQAHLMSAVGTALGAEIAKIIASRNLPSGRTSRFCCPLDEALVECTLTVPSPAEPDDSRATADSKKKGSLKQFTLPPYGIYPSPGGRTRIGNMATAHLRCFFESLASSMGLEMTLRKVRGDNGHHVVESAFKALSRSLRNLLDGTDTATIGDDDCDDVDNKTFEGLWGVESESYKSGRELDRKASLSRSTKETSINVDLQLDWMHSGVTISTGIAALDSILETLAREAKVSLMVDCKGDTWVDDHHTSEDVAIAIGQCLNKALGTKAGLNRMWCAQATSGKAKVEVVMDLSNRPCLNHNLSLSENVNGEEFVGDMSIEMFEHVLDSLVMNGQMTVHVVEVQPGEAVMETALAAAAAFGRALRLCSAVDPRRAGKTASSKGTLSV